MWIILYSILVITKTVSFTESDILFDVVNGYQVPKIKDCNFIPHPGEPQLPVKAVYFLLPEGTRVKEVRLGTLRSITLQGKYNIYPSQPPQILEIPDPKSQIPISKSQVLPTKSGQAPFVEPKPEIYASPKEYPGNIIEFVGEGLMQGYRIAEILVHPLQWIPKTNQLNLYTDMEIILELSEASWQKTFVGNRHVCSLLEGLVINPEEINPHNFKQPEFSKYLIITADISSFVSAFQSLADWKTKKGVPAMIRTNGWIYNNYPGRDLAERIRNYIRVAVYDSGVQWVLLGGDINIIPTRQAYAMTCGWGTPGEDSIPADLYYSDLDGSWDANNNNLFGEIEDSVDLYPDVFVGRAPVNTEAQIQAFVSKIIKYEQTPPIDYLDDALFMAEILWPNPYTDAGVGKNMIGELFPNSYTIEKLYESLGNESQASVLNAMLSGKSLLNHDGHANYTVMCVGNGNLYIANIDSLKNGDAQGILYSIGCWPAAFDYDCIAEHWVLNPNGGGVAFIGNSRYGWGSPGNPGYGYSDKLDHSFYYNLFKDNVTNIGATLAKTKLEYVAYSRSKNVWRWHQYQVNLLGDPEMNIWTNTPDSLQVSYPESISVGENVFKVNLSLPLAGAVVCCEKQGEVYEVRTTNEAGEVIFALHPSSPGNVQVCASFNNYLPYLGTVNVYSTGAYPGYYGSTIIDSNRNGEVNPNEPIDLLVTLKNYGNQPANNVNAYLTTTDPYTTILDSSDNFGNIAAGNTAQSDFKFRVSNCPNGHLIECNLQIIGFGSIGLNFLVKTPWLVFQSYAVSSTPLPCDTFDLWLTIKNDGGLAPNVNCKISSEDPNLVMVDTLNNFGSLGSNLVISRPYRVGISPSCPAPYFAPVILELSSFGLSFMDTFLLSIGPVETSFFDNIENGTNNWIHGGIIDLWTITDNKSHSATHSWYCGNTGTYQYANGMNCWALSPQIILAPNSYLSFWTWFDVATYGVDGIYPIIKRGSVEDTLDFIGSGGALREPNTSNRPVPMHLSRRRMCLENVSGTPTCPDTERDGIKDFTVDWSNKIYDLSQKYPVGCTLQVKIGFSSDANDTAQGFYIDDMRIGELETLPNLRMALIDIRGDNDSIVDPGESVFVYLWLINDGIDSVTGANGIVSCNSPYVTLLPQDSLNFGNILGRRVVNGMFSFALSSSAQMGQELLFRLQVAGGATSNWVFDIKTIVGISVEEQKYDSRPYFSCLPNPFKKSITISYSVPKNSKTITPVSLKIYDLAGRVVETLVDRLESPGNYTVSWKAQKCGIYFVKFELEVAPLPNYTATKKLILLK
ncbi:MAG: hypothetical protein HY769_03950 [Candidatus Stahlbacteria bacterium]|nr:hypothetical protein [Candidatus Stahlbacteria bacterium]